MRERIKEEYLMLRTEIEETWADRHIPAPVMSAYLLFDLISLGDVDAYLSRYGQQSLDVEMVREGKQNFLGLPDITPFEEDVVRAINLAVETMKSESRTHLQARRLR